LLPLAVVPHGSADQIAEAARAQFDAGADHLALQPLGDGPAPVADYRALVAALVWAAQASARRSAEGVCPVSLRMTRQRWL
jgi:hypothetical protein